MLEQSIYALERKGDYLMPVLRHPSLPKHRNKCPIVDIEIMYLIMYVQCVEKLLLLQKKIYKKP